MSIQTTLEKIFHEEYYSKKYIREGIPDAHDLHIPVFAKEFPRPTHAFDLEKQILDKISAPFGDEGTLSTLILGDSGSGKSWLAHKVTKSLFTALDLKLKVPLYIPLRAVEEVSCDRSSDCREGKTFQYTSICFSCRKPNNILFAYLQLHFTSIEQIEQMYRDLQKFELIMFLDGYDELQDKVNLWSVNKWDLDRYRVRTYVFGRQNSLLSLDISELFIFCKNGKRRETVQYVISPLGDTLVKKYVQSVPHFLKGIDLEKCVSGVNDPWFMTKKAIVQMKSKAKAQVLKDWESGEVESSEYHYWFYKMLPELQELSRNVYLLTIICQILPILVEEKRREISDPDDFVTALKQICETEVCIYDEFTKAWVSYQVNKIKEHGETLGQISSVLKYYMFAYAQNLAIHCISFNKGALFDGLIRVGMTEFWNLWVPLDPYDLKDPKEPIFKRDLELEKALFPRDDRDEDEVRLKNLRSLRNASLLQYDKESKKFEFFHLSLLEYFASRDIFVNLRAHLNFYINYDRGDESYFIINRSNISDQKFQGILTMVVDKAQQDANFQKILLKSIKKSAEIPGIECMASNAMTILNFCGYNFSGNHTDFRNIQVPYANMRSGVFGNSDFTGANFKGANLSEGWFQNCRFQGANFADCHFGEHRPTELGKNTTVLDMVCHLKAGVYHVVLCCEVFDQNQHSLYCKTFKYSSNFRLFAQEQILVLHQYTYGICTHLINKRETVYLLISRKTFLNEKKSVPVPHTLYELNFASIVKAIDINFNVSELELFCQAQLKNAISFQKRYIILEMLPRFSTEEEFFEKYLHLPLASDIGRTIYITRYMWLPVGSLKLLIAILFELKSSDIDKVDMDLTRASITDITYLHKNLPIVAEEELESFEIWWGLFDLQFETYDPWLDKTVFDGNSLLSFSIAEFDELEEHDRNVFFFDLHKSQRIPYVTSLVSPSNLRSNYVFTSNRLAHSRKSVAIWHQDEVILEFKSTYVNPNFKYKVSESFDFVAHGRSESIDIIETATGNIQKNLPRDIAFPFIFVTSCDYTLTNFVYIHGNALQFIQLSSNQSNVNFSLDAKLRKMLRLKVTTIEKLIQMENIDSNNVFDRMVIGEVMVTKNQFVICKAYSDADRTYHKLIAFGHNGMEVPLLGIPRSNRFMHNKILVKFLRHQERILIGTFEKFSVFALQEQNEPVSGQDIFAGHALKLIKLSSDRCHNRVRRSDVSLVMATAPNGCYLVTHGFKPKPEYVFYWNPIADSCTKLKIVYSQDTSVSKTVNEDPIPCCFHDWGLTLIGNVVLQQKFFHVTNVFEPSTQYPNLVNDESVLDVQITPTLHWLVMLTIDGEIDILDADSLQPMFSFQGFNKGVEFYVEQISVSLARIITWTLLGQVTWLEINAKSLRKYFHNKNLEAFRDWRIEKFELPSTTLSLYQSDIGNLRGIDEGSLEFLKHFESRGDPSDEVYVPFCSLFEPVTDSVESLLSPSGAGKGGAVDLNDTWTVTVIVKRSEVLGWTTSDWHSGLILEGIHYNRHFVIRAELVLKAGVGSLGMMVQDSTDTHRVNVVSLGAGNKTGYLEIVENYDASQFEVTKTGGMKLLNNIWGDTRREWSYCLRNNNCNTWVEQKLALIGYTFPERSMFSKLLHLPNRFF